MNILLKLIFSILFYFTFNESFSQSESNYRNSVEIEKDILSSTISFQFASWEYSFIGDYQNALRHFDRSLNMIEGKSIPDSIKTKFKNFVPISALEYIISRSSTEKIIIINEAHHQPKHRVFTEQLLEALYKNGFRYFGLEAIAEDSALNIRKWPSINDGFYTMEPQFGNLIRRALDIGFTIFGYESIEKGKMREIGQAENILKLIQKDSTAKILIHCGFGHLIEDGHPTLGKAMAGELKDRSGIDPFTIDQVTYTEHSSKSYESPLYDMLNVSEVSVLVDKNNTPFNFSPNSTICDVRIVHPRTKFLYGRPNWLLRDEKWKVYSLEKNEFTFPYLVSAYRFEEDSETSVPVDQIEINENKEYSLILPNGKYNLIIRGAEGSIDTKEIIVK